MEEEVYTVYDLIDDSVAKVPDLSYLHSEFDDYGYSDLNGAITDEVIEVGTEQLEKIQREGEQVIADINAQIHEKIIEQEQKKSETGDSVSDSDTDSDGTDSATIE
jgi:hypothetical protein